MSQGERAARAATSLAARLVSVKVMLVAVVVLIIGGGIGIVVLSTMVSNSGGVQQSAQACAPPAEAIAAAPTPPKAIRAQQIQNARIIDATTRKLGMPGTAARLAIVTAMNESTVLNIHYGDRDSQGLFQQRPSQGWGTVEQVTNPEWATTSFLIGPRHDRRAGLIAVKNWETISPEAAIYAVQLSATTDPTRDDHAPADALIREAGLDLSYGWAGGQQQPTTEAAQAGNVASAEQVAACVGATTPVGAGAAIDARGVPQFPSQGGCPAGQPIVVAPNGGLDAARLCGALGTRHLLQPAAANALAAMAAAYSASTGKTLCILDGYRTYADQVVMKQRRGSWAATPGTSNHGLGLAVDLCGDIGWDSSTYAWLAENSTRFGWIHSASMSRTSSLPEPWHWEFATYLPGVVPYYPQGTPSQYPMKPIDAAGAAPLPSTAPSDGPTRPRSYPTPTQPAANAALAGLERRWSLAA